MVNALVNEIIVVVDTRIIGGVARIPDTVGAKRGSILKYSGIT